MTNEFNEINRLIDLMARLPGLGPVSSRRIVLHLLKSKNGRLTEISEAMRRAADAVGTCAVCGNFCSDELCRICHSEQRKNGEICVVQDIADLWAMERAAVFKGRYHVLGGVLSMLDSVGPEELRIPDLVRRVSEEGVKEIILALNATVDGQTTAHYIADQFSDGDVRITSLGQGVPMGGELNYLDDGTITAAMNCRREY